MPHSSGRAWRRFILSSVVLLGGVIDDAYSARSSSSTFSGPATCPSRTVNYITHILPQQCLKSSWSSPEATTSQSDAGADTSNPISRDAIPTAVESIIGTEGVVVSTLSGSEGHLQNQTVLATESTTGGMTSLPSLISVYSASFTATGEANSVLPSPSPPDADPDSESPLGNADFLSFEQWKKQNLKKLGQSAEHIDHKKQDHEGTEPRRRPGNMNGDLDVVGDDAEIDLEFGGFAAVTPHDTEPTTWGRQVEKGADEESASEGSEGHSPRKQSRGKDAGTTCKERFNYASFDCAATVRKTNPECSSPSSVLVENKDSYMLNECGASNKFLILELCDDIAIDTIVLANFEFFSSIFRTFKVSVSDRYPVKLDKWLTLGTYEARNSREVQAFLVENPLIWARYLRIEFLTHYGNEFYCPLSLIRVHGRTMMEDYKHDGELSKADEESDEDVDEAVKNGERMATEAVADSIVQERIEDAGHAKQLLDQAEQTSPQLIGAEDRAGSAITPFNKADFELERSASSFEMAHPVCLEGDYELSAPKSEPATSAMSSQDTPSQTDSTTKHASTSRDKIDSTSSVSSQQSSSSSVTTILQSNSSSITTPTSSPQSQPTNSSTTTDSTGQQKLSNQNTNSSASVSSTSTPTTSSPPNPTIAESFFKSVQKRLTQLETNTSLSLQYIESQSRLLHTAFSAVEKRQLAKTTTFLESLNATVLSELREFRRQYDQIWQSTVIELETQREQYERERRDMEGRLGILAGEVVFQKRMGMLQSLLVLVCLGLVIFSRGAMNSYLELPIVQNVIARSPSFRSSLETPEGGSSPSPTRPGSAYAGANAEKRSEGALALLKGRFGSHHRRTPSDESTDDNVSSPASPMPRMSMSLPNGLGGPAISHSPPTPVSADDEEEDDDRDNDRGDENDEEHNSQADMTDDDEDDEESQGEGGPDGGGLRVESPVPDVVERPVSSPPVLSGSAANGDGDVFRDT